MIDIIDTPIDAQSVLDSVQSDLCGANLLFCGTTRRLTDGKETQRLEYEAYREMAMPEIEALCQRAKSQWSVEKISVVHRVGLVAVGETSIAIAVSAPHRKAAFSAGQWLLDELKKVVPIWKKEEWTDGSTEWIHPPTGITADSPNTRKAANDE